MAANELKFGFAREQDAQDFMYEVWRVLDIDIRNPRPPNEALMGQEVRWQLGNSQVLIWAFGKKKHDNGLQAAGLKQYPAFVVFHRMRSHASDTCWNELNRIAMGYGAAAL